MSMVVFNPGGKKNGVLGGGSDTPLPVFAEVSDPVQIEEDKKKKLLAQNSILSAWNMAVSSQGRKSTILTDTKDRS